MKKRVLVLSALAAVSVFSLGLLSGAQAAEGLTPGTYTGTARGFHDDVTVEVVVDEEGIQSVAVTDCRETRFIADNAIYALPEDIVAQQNINVDAYSGCTISSMAVKSAVKNALSEAGDITPFQKEKEEAEAAEEELDTDVVVIGGGMAGLSAALTAKEAGADVILLEKLDRLGGSTVLSGGFLYATGSPVNKDLDDDPEAMVEYWQMRAEGNANEDMLRIAAELSGETVAQLQDWGVVFSTTVVPTGTSPALRGLYASNEEVDLAPTDGVDFIAPLAKKAEELGIQVMLGTAATELILEDGEVKGVKAASDDTDYTIRAGSVVIATGGFDHNKEMISQYSPEAEGFFSLASPGNKGDGVAMAEAAGAATNFTGGVIGFKMIDITSHYIEGANYLGWTGQLGVTNEGLRFGDETADYPIFCTELIDALKAGAEKFYLIVDSTNESFAGMAELALAKNLAVKADTLDELAEAAGIDADNLIVTVESYNGHAEAGDEDEYGRTGLTAVTTAPYYAVQIKPAILGTMGGLLINEDSAVVNEEGEAIPNLYAAGEVANSAFFYKEYPASGSSISTCATFGRIAGRNAAANAAE
ncbi:MAG: FAD-dependent oxidoreductase [Blautia sp.]|nr:FAD-dependent oxidoreductase [Blautia sp.]